MGLSRSRTITLVVAVATLTSNALSSILFSQLPDDPYHLASNFSWYLHFANILSVFGFIGALRQHALSIALFANYLIIDTILCAIPRFLLLTLLSDVSTDLCMPSSPSYPVPHTQTSLPTSSTPTAPFGIPDPSILSPLGLGDDWSPEGCFRILTLAQLTLVAGLIAATLLQFVGALQVREYGRALWLREVREEVLLVERAVVSSERRSLCETRGLPVIFEEGKEKC